MQLLSVSERIDLDGVMHPDGFDNFTYSGMGGIVSLDDRFIYSVQYRDPMTSEYVNGWTAWSQSGEQITPLIKFDTNREIYIQNAFW